MCVRQDISQQHLRVVIADPLNHLPVLQDGHDVLQDVLNIQTRPSWGREGGREGGREEGRKEGRAVGREGGREGGRE